MKCLKQILNWLGGDQTYLTKLYHELKPHQGYINLLDTAKNKFNSNYFVITSNVDS